MPSSSTFQAFQEARRARMEKTVPGTVVRVAAGEFVGMLLMVRRVFPDLIELENEAGQSFCSVSEAEFLRFTEEFV
jgi:hypothetical protein